MKNNKKTSFLNKFDRLCKEALEDENLFSDEDEDVIDDYEDIEDKMDDNDNDNVTITLSKDQIEVLKDVVSQYESQYDESDDESDDESNDDYSDDYSDDYDESDISDIEELGKEAVESENAPDGETARKRTKSGKAGKDTSGDLERETTKKDDEDKQYKFVKREKPDELKYKTTKGS